MFRRGVRGQITSGPEEAESLVSGEPHTLMSLLPRRIMLVLRTAHDVPFCHTRVSLYLVLSLIRFKCHINVTERKQEEKQMVVSLIRGKGVSVLIS